MFILKFSTHGRQCTYYHNIELLSSNHFCRGEAIQYYIFCVSVALGIQHVPHYAVSCTVVSYFSTLFHKRQDFSEKVIESKMCVLIVSTNIV
jgi:cytochrome c oxidase assembly protein Cox11